MTASTARSIPLKLPLVVAMLQTAGTANYDAIIQAYLHTPTQEIRELPANSSKFFAKYEAKTGGFNLPYTRSPQDIMMSFADHILKEPYETPAEFEKAFAKHMWDLLA